MDKIIKLNSRQGGPFTATQNLCDFDIPADGTYDLSESYINLFARIVGTASGATSTSIPNMDLGNDGGNGRAAAVTNLAVNWSAAPNRSFYNIAMVKNTSLTTEKVGVLEDIRRVDILRQTLNEYTQSTDKKESMGYKNLSSSTGQTGNRSSIFNQLYREGSTNSFNDAARIQIPLSQLIELGKMAEYPAMSMGKSRLHLELNLDKFAVVDATDRSLHSVGLQQFADVDNSTGGGALAPTFVSKAVYTRVEDSLFFVNQRVKVLYTSDDPIAATAANALVSSVKPAGGALQVFTLIAAEQAKPAGIKVNITSDGNDAGRSFVVSGYTAPDGPLVEETVATGPNSGSVETTNLFYKVTKITVDGDTAGNITIGWAANAAPVYIVERLIDSITYDDDSANVTVFKQTIGFDSNLPDVAATKKYTAIQIVPVRTQTPGSLSVDSAELVLRKSSANVKAPAELNYTTYSTEQYTGNNELDFQRMFQLEPEAVNVFITFPQHDLFSRNGDLKSFRMRLDGEDLVDRDISVNEESHRDPLYYDRTSMTLLNAMLPLNCLAEENKPVQPVYNPELDAVFNGNEVLYDLGSGVKFVNNATVTLNAVLDNRFVVLNVPAADDGIVYKLVGKARDGSTIDETITFDATALSIKSTLRYHELVSVQNTTSTPTQALRVFAEPYKVLTIASPVPATAMEKLLQVNFDLSATTANAKPGGLRQMNLYKQVMRQVKP